jgi:transposase
MSAEFDARYARTGRPSVPPERRLRARLLQVLYTVRSERQLLAPLDYILLYRWFVGLGIDAPVWDRTVFCANRDRLLSAGAAREFCDRVLAMAEWQPRVSAEHFSVAGTLIDAWAFHKSFVRQAGNSPEKPAGRFHRRAAEQCHPPEHHRPRRPAVPDGRRHRGPAPLHHPRPGREPERPHRRS